MLTGTFVVLASTTNGQSFSKDCLKDVVKYNKDKKYSIGKESGYVDNFRMNKEEDKVLADFHLNDLVIATSGHIISKVEELKGNGVVTEFTITAMQIVKQEKK